MTGQLCIIQKSGELEFKLKWECGTSGVERRA